MKVLVLMMALMMSFLANAGLIVKLGMFPSTNQAYTVWYVEGGYTTAFNAVADEKGKVSLQSVVTSLGEPSMLEGYEKSFAALPVLRIIDLMKGEKIEGGKELILLTKKERRRWLREFVKIK